ncbi:hypothetical protein C8Q80DRAFT_418385 [Daedaleopsis nitida]|nr:hypothetical protein C8Q80DRAFT_418385 [Daedaleopsis nitida]
MAELLAPSHLWRVSRGLVRLARRVVSIAATYTVSDRVLEPSGREDTVSSDLEDLLHIRPRRSVVSDRRAILLQDACVAGCRRSPHRQQDARRRKMRHVRGSGRCLRGTTPGRSSGRPAVSIRRAILLGGSDVYTPSMEGLWRAPNSPLYVHAAGDTNQTVSRVVRSPKGRRVTDQLPKGLMANQLQPHRMLTGAFERTLSHLMGVLQLSFRFLRPPWPTFKLQNADR